MCVPGSSGYGKETTPRRLKYAGPAKQAIIELSTPPLNSIPTGTSDRKRIATERVNCEFNSPKKLGIRQITVPVRFPWPIVLVNDDFPIDKGKRRMAPGESDRISAQNVRVLFRELPKTRKSRTVSKSGATPMPTAWN